MQMVFPKKGKKYGYSVSNVLLKLFLGNNFGLNHQVE